MVAVVTHQNDLHGGKTLFMFTFTAVSPLEWSLIQNTQKILS